MKESQEKYQVLLVEDETEIADMLSIFFEDRGFILYHAFNGEEALQKVPSVMPHVILMDITLPDMDGYEICRRLRQQPRTSHIPIIFLTRRGSRDDRLAGLELGADDFISKPFDIEELMLRMRNSVQRAARESQIDPRTGLPSARLLLPVIDAARANPAIAMLEFTINHTEPLRHAYGVLAGGDVSVYVAQLIARTVHELGHEDDFIGYLDEHQFVALTKTASAMPIAERIATTFQQTVRNHYNKAALVNNQFVVDGVAYPMMTLTYRLFAPDQAWIADHL